MLTTLLLAFVLILGCAAIVCLMGMGILGWYWMKAAIDEWRESRGHRRPAR